jgi:hypothetical protein
LPQFLKQYGEQLVALGYTVLPIRPGTKRPDLKNWPQHETSEEDVRKWYSNGRADHGVGVNARWAPAIDVDVLDPEVAQQMSDAIDAIFPGERLMTRTGLAPKFLVPFRSDEPFRKMTSHVYTDDTNEHKVEILGDGQQWVAYHIHPDTEQPYHWWDGLGDDGLRTVSRESLPPLSRGDAQRVIDAFERIASGKVQDGSWRLRSGAVDAASAGSVVGPDSKDDPFAAYAQPVTDLSRSQIEWLLKKLPLSDRDGWLRAGRILHDQYGASEEGFDFWTAISEDHEKYDADDQRRVWESFGHSDKPETLRALLKEFGQPPAEHKPAPPHPQATKDDPVPFTEGSLFAEGFQDIDWLIEDVVPRAQVGVIYGASGSGKTFFALDMACAVQRGGVWRLKQIEQADTFYIAAEAGNGIKKRIAAYIQAKGAGALPWFVDYQPNLATLESVHAISASVKLRSASPGLIFVDTMALSHDGDENSSKDMSLLLRNCKVLSDDTGALVVLVHHTGKDESRGMRGSSAIYAGADFVLEISAQEKDHEMVVDKLKDGERGARFGFRLPAVEVGSTPRGKVITSCYVEESDKTLEKGKKNGRKPLTHQAQIFIFDVFSEALGMSESMSETELVEAVKAKQRAADNVPSQSQSIKGSINKMVISGHICKEGESLSLPHSTHSTHSSSFE